MSQSATPTQAETCIRIEHILGTFLLVFPDGAEDQTWKDGLPAAYDRDPLVH